MTTSAVGLDDPTLSFNLSELADYVSAHPFIDLMKYSRPFVGSTGSTYAAMDHQALIDGGYLDEDGWPTSIPDDVDKITTLWSMGSEYDTEGMAGRYVVEWDGVGSISITGKGVTIVERTANSIVFDYTGETTSLSLSITLTDPYGTGDYIRNITVMKEEYVELYEAGQIFNPDFLALIEDARDIRFMAWMNGTSNSVVDWEDRSQVDDVTYMADGNSDGVPLEIMVELANQLGIDPWFVLPLGASEEYVRAFAEYVRDNLDPGLRATFETGNEIWNTTFVGWHKLVAMVEEAGWTYEGETAATLSMYAKIATTNALIIDEVFGDEAEERVYNVIGTQTVSKWVTEQELVAGVWQANEPDTYVAPSSVFDAVAATSYFGSAILSTAALREELTALLAESEEAATAWLIESLMDPDFSSSIPSTLASLLKQATLLDEYGLDLVLYEGGQHVDHQYSISDVSEELQAFLRDFVRSDAMAELYQVLWDGWAEIGDGAFMQFTAVEDPSIWGAWGLYWSLYDNSARAELLEELNATTENWFDDRSGEFFQQGVYLQGTDDDDTLEGTTQEDFLLGGAGDDILDGGEEDDGLHGGDGNDILYGGAGSDVLVGGDGRDIVIYDLAFADYQITTGEFLEVTDLATLESDTLKGIEYIQFSDGRYAVATGLFTEGASGLPDDDGTDDDGTDDDETATEIIGSEGDDVIYDIDGWQLIDGDAGEDSAIFDSFTNRGLWIQGINYSTTTGKELVALFGASSETPLYFVTENGTEFVGSDGESSTTYLVSQGSGVAVALMNGNVVINVEAITGSVFADTFMGGNASEVVDLGAGNDKLYGYGGADWLSGGDGNDRIYGGNGDDILLGGTGKNTLKGEVGNDTFIFGGGTDTVDGGAGTDAYDISDLLGTGVELVKNDDGISVLSDDTLVASLANIEEILFQGQTIDVTIDFTVIVISAEGRQTIVGSDGADEMRDIEGWQLIDGGAGEDTASFESFSGTGLWIQGIGSTTATGKDLVALFGTAATTQPMYFVAEQDTEFTGIDTDDNVYYEVSQNNGLDVTLMNGNVIVNVETITGSDLNDTFSGSSMSDVVQMGAGNDNIFGNGGADWLSGGDGNDRIYGGKGEDILLGGTGTNTLQGEAGNDTFIFGGGTDTVDGGDGQDVYVFAEMLRDEVQIIITTKLVTVEDLSGTILATLANVEQISFLDQIVEL